MRATHLVFLLVMLACKERQEDPPTLGAVLARLDQPILRPCETVREAVSKVFGSMKSERYRSLDTTAVDGGFRMVGRWSLSEPQPHGFRVVVTLNSVGTANCRAEVTSERMPEPSARSWSVPDRDAKLHLIAAFDPDKARSIREQLQKMKM